MLRLSNLSLGHGGRPLVSELDLEVLPGQSWGLLGQNGSGKTSLLHAIAGLSQPLEGAIWLFDREIRSIPRKTLARQLGLLTQDEQDSFPQTLLDAALAGAYGRSGLWGLTSRQDQALAQGLLNELALESGRLSSSLSGGERRRLGLARLLVQNPMLALLDEPDSHLDICRKGQLLKRVQAHFCTQERACLMSLHDIQLAQRFCSHLLLLFGDGRWLAGPAAGMLDAKLLGELYGCKMV